MDDRNNADSTIDLLKRIEKSNPKAGELDEHANARQVFF